MLLSGLVSVVCGLWNRCLGWCLLFVLCFGVALVLLVGFYLCFDCVWGVGLGF